MNLTPTSLFPRWMSDISLQQQAVLISATRGWDGDEKDSPMKTIVRTLRGSILMAAHLGRMLSVGESAGDYMTLREFEDVSVWERLIREFVNDQSDKVTLHAYTHLMHAAEVLAYKHPSWAFRVRWMLCYSIMADRLHLNIESVTQMDARLSDFCRHEWDPVLAAEQASA